MMSGSRGTRENGIGVVSYPLGTAGTGGEDSSDVTDRRPWQNALPFKAEHSLVFSKVRNLINDRPCRIEEQSVAVLGVHHKMTAPTNTGSSVRRSKDYMDQGAWKIRVMVRYALLQLPALVLLGVILVIAGRCVELPSWFIWCLISLWIAKDLCLYPLVWRAYDHGNTGKANSMVGTHGIALDRLDPAGYIEIRGELWWAEITENSRPINKGKGARVRGIRGLTLLVSTDDKEI